MGIKMQHKSTSLFTLIVLLLSLAACGPTTSAEDGDRMASVPPPFRPKVATIVLRVGTGDSGEGL